MSWILISQAGTVPACSIHLKPQRVLEYAHEPGQTFYLPIRKHACKTDNLRMREDLFRSVYAQSYQVLPVTKKKTTDQFLASSAAAPNT